jgi:hypothetical protein
MTMGARNAMLVVGLCLAMVGCGDDDPADGRASGAPQAEDAARAAPAAPLGKPVVAPVPAAAPQMLELDADRNGLYDDTERKAVWDAVQRMCPALQSEVFDRDGDGKVTIEEEATGRPPLPFIIPKQIVEDERKIPWTIDLFPEWLSSAFLQEDVTAGPVSGFAARGVISSAAAQPQEALRPTKGAGRGGIEFAANTGQHVTMPGQRDARWNYRWCVLAFRIDQASGTDDSTVLLDINSGRGPSKSTPKVWYSKTTGLSVQAIGRGANGLDQRLMTASNVVADGTSWNVLVCGIRQGRLFASVNGVALQSATPQPGRFGGEMASDVSSMIGDQHGGNMAWAFDAVVLGMSEPSEAMVRKLSGWAAHRLGFAQRLPEGHPYRQYRPVLDLEDFPHRYIHDDAAWTAWGQGLTKAITRVNTGGERVDPVGFERVFYDDFRKDRIGLSTSADADLWGAPGFNTAVGASVPLNIPGRKPEVYIHDAQHHTQTLSLDAQNNRWVGSAFYSVNDMGQGYTWTGPKVFRIRCMFPKIPQQELAQGLFPAFWSYGTEWLFWRTSNRIEADWFEFDGKDGFWLNGVATHFHYPHVKSIFPMQTTSYKRYKVFGSRMSEDKLKTPGGLYVWDGQYHTWEYVVDQDMFHVNVTVEKAGREQWIEICRSKTAPTYLERLDLQLDYALKLEKNGAGAPKSGRQDFVVDWVEVLQKSSDVASVPMPFASRPMLSGADQVGGTITCTAKLGDIQDVRYYWFADGYPLTYGADSSYVITADEAGARIRCMVKAVGARDMPEAWSDAIVVGGAHVTP